MKWELKSFSELFTFLPKSKIKAGEGKEEGKYPFFTCSSVLDKYYDDKIYSGECLVIGTGGNATLHYINGDFATSTDCFVVRSSSSEILVKYVYYFLFGNIRILEEGFKGSGLKHISKSYLNSIKIPIPPLDIQRKTINVLDKVLLLLENRKEQVAVLDKLAKDTFIDMFGDPVVNPNGFDIRNLQEFYADSKNAVKCGPFGSALKKNEYTDRGIPVWTMDNITKNGNFINDVYLRISEEKYEQLKAYSVKDGDVIISRAGTVGKMCVVQSGQEKSIISTNLIRVRFNDELLPSFFVSLMTYCANKLTRLKKGDDGAFTHMSTDVLNNINFPYPPLDLQKQYTVRIAAITRQKHLLEESIAELETTYKATMQKAFDGVLL